MDFRFLARYRGSCSLNVSNSSSRASRTAPLAARCQAVLPAWPTMASPPSAWVMDKLLSPLLTISMLAVVPMLFVAVYFTTRLLRFVRPTSPPSAFIYLSILYLAGGAGTGGRSGDTLTLSAVQGS